MEPVDVVMLGSSIARRVFWKTAVSAVTGGQGGGGGWRPGMGHCTGHGGPARVVATGTAGSRWASRLPRRWNQEAGKMGWTVGRGRRRQGGGARVSPGLLGAPLP